MTARLQVVGIRRLRATLNKAGIDLGEKLKPVHMAAASVVAVEARRRVPVVTGALRDTIGPGATKRAGVVRAGFRSIPYARPINYGWARRNIEPTWFINGAAKKTEERWTALYMDELNRVLESIKGA